MHGFDYAAPTTLAEAVSLLARHPDARILAGGTDLLVQLRSRRRQTPLVIDGKRIPELIELSNGAGGLTLGAAVPCYRIYGDAEVRRAYPALADLAGLIGGTAIQGRASIGGNLCNSAPSADSIPLLIAMYATCRVASASGERVIGAEDFCTGPGRNVLASGELLVSIHIPAPRKGFAAHYLRFIPRNEMDIAVAGVGVSISMEEGIVREARVALASVAPVPLFVRDAGAVLEGKPLSDEGFHSAGEIAKAAAKPISDMRGTVDYRRHLCAVLTRRALEAAAKEIQ